MSDNEQPVELSIGIFKQLFTRIFMQGEESIKFAHLIEKNPIIQKVISKVNHELVTRRENNPSICKV
ncbi:MAG: hypothetical protein BWK74_07680, partial [Desulfobacteraceae bacterium A6]